VLGSSPETCARGVRRAAEEYRSPDGFAAEPRHSGATV